MKRGKEIKPIEGICFVGSFTEQVPVCIFSPQSSLIGETVVCVGKSAVQCMYVLGEIHPTAVFGVVDPISGRIIIFLEKEVFKALLISSLVTQFESVFLIDRQGIIEFQPVIIANRIVTRPVFVWICNLGILIIHNLKILFSM